MPSAIKKIFWSILLRLKHVLENPAVQFILFIFYSVVIAYYSIEDFRKRANLYLHKDFSDFLLDKSIELVLLAVFLSAFPIILISLKKLESTNLPSFNVLHAINIGFGQIVNHKATRFDNFYKSHINGTKYTDDIFQEITQPDGSVSV